MAFRELRMIDVREVVCRRPGGESLEQIARAGVADRKTATREVAAAKAPGGEHESKLDEEAYRAFLDEVGRGGGPWG